MAQDLSNRMLSVLEQPQLDLLRLVAGAAESLGMALYAVGGLPRDIILGLPSHDVDLVVEGDAIHLAQSLARSRGGRVSVHRRFGTATWHHALGTRGPNGFDGASEKGSSLDLVTARTETYPQPAKLPHVRRGTIEDDLRRRDFVMNAIAIRLDGANFGRLLDPLGGIDDLRMRRVRSLHDRSFVDDPTRMYRAVRYEQRLGFRIQRHTRELMREGSQWVGAVTGARLRNELDLILLEERSSAMLKRLASLDLLRRIDRSLRTDATSLRRLASISTVKSGDYMVDPGSRALETRWMLWLMDLRPGELRSIGQRLAFPRRRMELLFAAADLYQTAAKWDHWLPSKLTAKLDGLPEQAVSTVHAVLRARRGRTALDSYLLRWRHMRIRTTGRDLQQLGLKPGPRYRLILQSLRAAWIDGAIQDADGERELLTRMISRGALDAAPSRTPRPSRPPRKR